MLYATRVLCLVFLMAAAFADTQSQDLRYHGVCDASAAVALGPNYFVVAEDEHDILAIYRRGNTTPVATVDISDYLGNRKSNGKIKEADIEGAARIGNRIYWIASHGRDKKGEIEETRWRFFATDVMETASTPTVKTLTTPPYKRLLKDLISETKFEPLALATASEKPPEDPVGLNIEGLAATSDEHLLIGLRNPRPSGKAVIIPIENPREVVDKSAKPIFGDTILLDLGRRGIRAIEFIGGRYAIVAGPFDDGTDGGAGSDFALFTWSGGAAHVPERVEGAAFGKLRPEALFAIPRTDEVDVLSDDGEEKIEGVRCKDKGLPAEKKFFRGITLMFPMVLAATPTSASAPPTRDAQLIAAVQARYTTLIATGGRYMEKNCSATNAANWTGFVLMRCNYTHLGASANVSMLNPDAAQLARWTVTACRDAAANHMEACTQHIIRRIWSASNAQFPVTGYVIEPKSVLGGTSNAPLCFLFRDGVTIRTASVTTRPPQNGRCVPEDAESESATHAFNFARIASTTREEYRRLSGSPDVGASGGGDLRFIDAIRKEWQAAWGSDRNRLLSAAAIADRARGKFN